MSKLSDEILADIEKGNPPSTYLEVRGSSKSRFAAPIFRISADGKVEVNPLITLDEAAIAFWDAIRRNGKKEGCTCSCHETPR